MEWVPLIAGLCATVVEHSSPPLIAVGYVDQDKCQYRLMLPDTHDDPTPPLEVKPNSGQSFRYIAQIKPNGAFLFLNDLMFEIPRGEQL